MPTDQQTVQESVFQVSFTDTVDHLHKVLDVDIAGFKFDLDPERFISLYQYLFDSVTQTETLLSLLL